MSPTESFQQRVAKSDRLVDQSFITDEIEISGFPVNPPTRFFKANNFIQQTLSRAVGFDDTAKSWRALQVDSSGRLILSPAQTEGARVMVFDRESIVVTVFDALSIPATSAATHAGVLLEEFTRKTVMISSSAAVTLYPQFSDDNVNWYDWVDLNDAAISFSITNAKKAFGFTDHSRYFRLVAHNSGASAVTVTGVITGLV